MKKLITLTALAALLIGCADPVSPSTQENPDSGKSESREDSYSRERHEHEYKNNSEYRYNYDVNYNNNSWRYGFNKEGFNEKYYNWYNENFKKPREEQARREQAARDAEAAKKAKEEAERKRAKEEWDAAHAKKQFEESMARNESKFREQCGDNWEKCHKDYYTDILRKQEEDRKEFKKQQDASREQLRKAAEAAEARRKVRQEYADSHPLPSFTDEGVISALGLKPGATPEQIDKAFKNERRKTHPDMCNKLECINEHLRWNEAHQRFKEKQEEANRK